MPATAEVALDRRPPAKPLRHLSAKGPRERRPERLDPIRMAQHQHSTNRIGGARGSGVDQLRDYFGEFTRESRIGNYNGLRDFADIIKEPQPALNEIRADCDFRFAPNKIGEHAQLGGADGGEMAGEVDPAQDGMIRKPVKQGEHTQGSAIIGTRRQRFQILAQLGCNP